MILQIGNPLYVSIILLRANTLESIYNKLAKNLEIMTRMLGQVNDKMIPENYPQIEDNIMYMPRETESKDIHHISHEVSVTRAEQSL